MLNRRPMRCEPVRSPHSALSYFVSGTTKSSTMSRALSLQSPPSSRNRVERWFLSTPSPTLPRQRRWRGQQNRMPRRLIVREETWDIGGGFSITRARKWAAEVLMVEIHQDGVRGRGEGVPYRRLGEKLETVAKQIQSLRKQIETQDMTRAQ